jgi:hypothetical protein
MACNSTVTPEFVGKKNVLYVAEKEKFRCAVI